MRSARWLLGVLFLAALFAIPSSALAAGEDDPTTDDPGITQQGPSDEGDQADPSLEPPQVLQDPGTPQQPEQPAQAPEQDAPAFAPPVQELGRFADDNRAPQWQQRDQWRPRGLFYRWRQGWFARRQFNQQFIWWQWRDGRWSRCDQPGDFRDDVVRPVPLADPSPGVTFNPVDNAIAPIQAPHHVPVPTQQNQRAQALRRALRVCQVRYVRSVIVLRILRQRGRITFQQYTFGVRRALERRAVCRRIVFRAFSRPVAGPVRR